MPGIWARPDGVRPNVLLRGSAQHDRGDLEEALIVLGELKSSVFKGFAEVVELREIDMTGRARGAVLA